MANAPWLGALALVAAAVAYDLLLWRVRRADRGALLAGGSIWWLGYARDAANLAGTAGFTAAFWLLGLPGPLALIAGASMCLAGYGLDYVVARTFATGRPERIVGAVLVLAAALAAATRHQIEGALACLVAALFA